ncbi:hypothetical protein GEMRC1_011309 [Eukaryota sp. GEM-RC1]
MAVLLDHVKTSPMKVIELIKELGSVTFTILTLFDENQRLSFGEPTPITVKINENRPGSAVLVYGDNLDDLYSICANLQGKSTIYTSGDLLKAHAFPEFQKFDNLVGHYSDIWQDQRVDFDNFPGLIILLNGPTLPTHLTETNYSDRLITAKSCGIPKITHLLDDNGILDFSFFNQVVIPGFDPLAHASYNPYLLHTGFNWHGRLREYMPEFAECFVQKQFENILIIGGSEGNNARDESLFMKFFKNLPETTLVFTFGSAKFRILSALPHLTTDFSISRLFPRLMDFGSTEDVFSILKALETFSSTLRIPMELLPVTFVISWYDSMMVVPLLSKFDIKRVYIEPCLPVFFSQNTSDLLS